MATKAEIRLQIVTALDKAGIKATKEQVDMMTASVMDANRRMGKSLNETTSAFGRMHGPLGKLQSALGNFGGIVGKVTGTVGMMAGALETGVAIGTKMWQGIQYIRKEWMGYVSELDQVVAANKKLEKQRRAAAEQYDAQFAQMHSLRERELADSKAALDAIKTEAEAYRTAAKAKLGLLTAGMGAEEQILERERFEDILALQANGYDGAAVEQVEAIYDLLKAELAVKKEIARLDAEEDAANAKRVETERKMADAVERETDAKHWQNKVAEHIRQLEEWDFADAERTTEKERDRRLRKARRESMAASAAVRKAQQDYDALKATLAPEEAEAATLALRRATAMDAAYLARDRAALAYDNATAQGDALGVAFNKDYIENLNRSSLDSYRVLVKIHDDTAAFAGKLEELLTMKGGQ